jgi:hypothetical protein
VTRGGRGTGGGDEYEFDPAFLSVGYEGLFNDEFDHSVSVRRI